MDSRCIHLFSSLSLCSLATLLSGRAVIKFTTDICRPDVPRGLSLGQLFRCLATVVSRSCSMSIK